MKNVYTVIIVTAVLVVGALAFAIAGRDDDRRSENVSSGTRSSAATADSREEDGTRAAAPADGEVSSENPPTVPEESDLDRLATLAFASYDGRDVTLAEFAGKPLVVNSWAVWCPFCRKELPDFSRLQEEFGEKIAIVAIDRRESLEKAKTYTDGLGITNDIVFLLDSSDSFYKQIGGFSMPETLFINAEGDIVVHKRGVMELDEMRELTEKIL